jgi:hypothetical protein
MVLFAKTGHVPTRLEWGDTSNLPSIASIHDNVTVWYASDVLIASHELTIAGGSSFKMPCLMSSRMRGRSLGLSCARLVVLRCTYKE